MATAAVEVVRSALCPPQCPVDFADVNALGEHLLRVLGPPQYPGWSAEYAVTRAQETCALCDQPIQYGALMDEGLSKIYVVGFLDGAFRHCHQACYMTATRKQVTDMATAKIVNLPDCRTCRLPYMEHDRPITTIWAATCEDGSYWRPAEPFRSRDWPHRMITDSPRYTEKAA